MNNCCCAELVVDEGQQIELSVETDGGIEVGVAEQFVIGGGGNYQSKTVNITPTESAQSQTVQADVGYDALDEVEVNVAAIADDYVGSAVPRKGVADVAINGDKFAAPSGYYASAVEKTMPTASWSASATKGAVSNHSVSVTPKASVTVAGYRPVGDKTGTAVSVSASELVSGTKSITANGTGIDVANYEKVDVAVPSQSPTGTKNISITANGTTTEDVAAYANAQITANVPNSYTAGDEGKVVDNGALVSQTSDTVTQNGTVDTTLINSLTVNVSGGGGTVITGSLSPAASTDELTIPCNFEPDIVYLTGVQGTYATRHTNAFFFYKDHAVTVRGRSANATSNTNFNTGLGSYSYGTTFGTYYRAEYDAVNHEVILHTRTNYCPFIPDCNPYTYECIKYT